MNAVQVLTLTMLVAAGDGAQNFRVGRCPKPLVNPNFDASRYLGKWFEIRKLPSSYQKGQCTSTYYTQQNPGIIKIVTKELLDNGVIISTLGTAKVEDPAQPAKMEVSFKNGLLRGHFWVLNTDYDNYALVYSCTNVGLFSMELAWILSRKPTLPRETIEGLLRNLSSIGVKVDRMSVVNQDHIYCNRMYQ